MGVLIVGRMNFPRHESGNEKRLLFHRESLLALADKMHIGPVRDLGPTCEVERYSLPLPSYIEIFFHPKPKASAMKGINLNDDHITQERRPMPKNDTLLLPQPKDTKIILNKKFVVYSHQRMTLALAWCASPWCETWRMGE